MIRLRWLCCRFYSFFYVGRKKGLYMIFFFFILRGKGGEGKEGREGIEWSW